MNQYISCGFGRNTPLLQCPVCNKDFERHATHIVCKNKHRFDVTQNNFINFYPEISDIHYEEKHFEASARLIENGLFRALESILVRLLMAESDQKKTLTVLDIGCGNGALFSNILLSLRWDNRCVDSFGIDITKESLYFSSRQDKQTNWLVSNLDRLPFRNHSADIILNTLAPANYSEFKRVLKPDGVIIKTIADTSYSEELLSVLSKNPCFAQPDNLFEEPIKLCEKIQVPDKNCITNEEKAVVLHTEEPPLGWMNKPLSKHTARIDTVSVDLQIWIGKLK